MAQKDTYDIRLPLTAFLVILENNDFKVSLDTRLRLYEALDKLGPTLLDHPEKLKLTLCPIVAKNSNDQEKFYRLFDQYYLDLQKEDSSQDQKPPSTRKRNRWKVIVLLLVLEILVALLVYNEFLKNTNCKKPGTNFKIEARKNGNPAAASANSFFVGDAVHFRNLTQELVGLEQPGKDRYAFEWSFGDGSRTGTTLLNPSHTYLKPGTFQVQLQVKNLDTKCDSTLISTVSIHCPPSFKLSFSIDPKQPRMNDEVQLLPDSLPANQSFRLEWELDDVSIGSAEQPAIQNIEAGNHTIRLTLTPLGGNNVYAKVCPITVAKQIHVGDDITIDYKTLQADHLRSYSFFLTDKAKWSYFGLLGVLLSLPGLWLVYRKTKQVRLKWGAQTPATNKPYEIPFPDKNHVLTPDPDLFEVANSFRQRHQGKQLRLDIKATIDHTIHNAGFPSLSFISPSQPTEYLVLIDRNFEGDVQAKAYTWLTKWLEKEDVLIEHYFFQKNPRTSWNSQKPYGVLLEDLHVHYSNHKLIIFGDGNHFFDPETDELFPWLVHALQLWDHRALLTPKPPEIWEHAEHKLTILLPVFPATVSGHFALLHNFFHKGSALQVSNTSITGFPAIKEKNVPELLGTDLSEATTLEQYLGAENYLWLCSIAVYPRPYWEIILVIGRALEMKLKETSGKESENAWAINYTNLLQIGRIPWLQEGVFPAGLREKLLAALPEEYAKVARDAVVGLLDEVNIPNDSFAYREQRIQRAVQVALGNPEHEAAQDELNELLQLNLIDEANKEYALKKRKPLQPGKRIVVGGVLLLMAAGGLAYFEISQDAYLESLSDVFPLEEWNLVTKMPETDTVAVLNNMAVELYNSGIAQFDTLRIRKATSYLSEAVKLKPQYAVGHANLGRIQFNNGVYYLNSQDYSKAVAAFEDASKIDTLYLDALNGMGISYFRRGDVAASKAMADRIYRIDRRYFKSGSNTLECLHYPDRCSIIQPGDGGIDLVKFKGKWGYKNSSGRDITAIIYDSACSFQQEHAQVMLNNKWGYINESGREITPIKYDEVKRFTNNAAPVRVGDKWGFINYWGREITPIKYDDVASFSGGLAKVSISNKWGYINYNGREVTFIKYDDLELFGEAFYLVKIDDKWGIVDQNKREITTTKYDQIGLVPGTLAKVAIGDKWGYIDYNGREITPIKYDVVEPFEGSRAQVMLNNKWGYVNGSGREITPIKYDEIEPFTDDVAPVQISGKWGFINYGGKEITPMKYEEYELFSEGRAKVMVDDKWGYINENGREIIPPKYEGAEPFHEGLAAVMYNGKWGYINYNGSVVIPFKYDDADSFDVNRARVKKNGVWMYVNRNGKESLR